MNVEYFLISTEYINNRTPLYYICPEGHIGSIRWNNWLHGKRCLVCSGKKRLTIEFIQSEFKRAKYTLTSKIYINCKSVLHYVCPKGHIGGIRWSNWRCGQRCATCAAVNNIGSGNPAWKGGISCEPYCQDWTKEFKDFIKQRDNYRCLNPYCKSKNPNDLTTHHIDYNKKNCDPSNLITVCRSCNVRANTDRSWHRLWYQTILNKRYGYIYDNTN